MTPSKELLTLINNAEKSYNLPPGLLVALIRQESGFNPKALSKAGARGIAQFMPATARSLGVNPWDVTSSINGAARYLSSLIKTFGSTELGLAAYNAGPGNVRKAGNRVPNFKETQNYVRVIMANAGLSTTAQKKIPYPQTQLETPQVKTESATLTPQVQTETAESKKNVISDAMIKLFTQQLKRQRVGQLAQATEPTSTRTPIITPSPIERGGERSKERLYSAMEEKIPMPPVRKIV